MALLKQTLTFSRSAWPQTQMKWFDGLKNMFASNCRLRELVSVLDRGTLASKGITVVCVL